MSPLSPVSHQFCWGTVNPNPMCKHQRTSVCSVTEGWNPAAIAIWTRTADLDHVWIVGAYYHYSVPGGWSEPEGIDISPKGGLFGRSDPMYVVTATKV